jgi:hypothetical protein
MLPSSMDTLWAGSNSYNLSELNTIQGGLAIPCLSSSLPFCVRFNLAVGKPTSTSASKSTFSQQTNLIAKLQHSIPSLWLGVTWVGIAPTCLQIISSTHVHRIVRPIVVAASPQPPCNCIESSRFTRFRGQVFRHGSCGINYSFAPKFLGQIIRQLFDANVPS